MVEERKKKKRICYLLLFVKIMKKSEQKITQKKSRYE